MPGDGERLASVDGAAVLSDDGLGDETPGPTVPDDRGFALVCDADGGDVASAQAGGCHRFIGGLQRSAPEIFGVMFDPVGLLIGIRELDLCHQAASKSVPNTMHRVEVVPRSMARI